MFDAEHVTALLRDISFDAFEAFADVVRRRTAVVAAAYGASTTAAAFCDEQLRLVRFAEKNETLPSDAAVRFLAYLVDAKGATVAAKTMRAPSRWSPRCCWGRRPPPPRPLDSGRWRAPATMMRPLATGACSREASP